MAFFGVTGLGGGRDSDDPICSAFVRGMMDLEISPAKTLRSVSSAHYELQSTPNYTQFLPSDPTNVLEVVAALYNRQIKQPDDLIAHISWSFSNISEVSIQNKFRAAIENFIKGPGVPPLAAFSVRIPELHKAANDPCYRAKRLLEACNGSELEPLGRQDWISVCRLPSHFACLSFA
jgi:hypothetical protein